MNFLYKILIVSLVIIYLFEKPALSQNINEDFVVWLDSYKKMALKKGISRETIETVFKNVKYLSQVIKYDRKQPEFFEDTITYVSKRANNARKNKARTLLLKNKNLFLKFKISL